MFVEDSDFVRLAANFKQYMENDLRLFKTQYNSELGITYPVFLLGDVKIYMNHYADFDYAVKKWEERKSRINWDELFFMLFTLSIDVAKDFSETVKKGVCFVPFSCNENLVMQLGFYKKIVDAENDFYKVVVGMAKGQYNYYDVWELLLNNRFIYRG